MDLRKQHELVQANQSAQDAFLQELKELNKVQAESGLPSLTAASPKHVETTTPMRSNSTKKGKEDEEQPLMPNDRRFARGVS